MMGYSGRQIADVFLSYSHDDREIVEKIASNIQARGFECWKDKDRLRAMDPFNVLIEEAIDESQVFIAFLSKTYVSKDYCIHEFNRAIDKKKSKIVVCIDDVNEYTNRKCSYMFSFSSGHNLLGFGSGFSTDEEFSAAVGDICDSVPMVQLKRYQTSGEPSDLPPANTPDYIFSQLRLYHERQYVQSGNYAFNEIRGDLFPSIKDTEINVIYKDEDQNEVSLIRYITDSQDDRSKKHIMLTGEGGMGKTISLLKTTEYLLQNGINAIYVPLSKIDRETPLDLYLERNVCGGNQNIWEYLKYTMSSAASDKDTTIVLLLDGINEIPLDYVEDFIKKSIKDVYIDSYKGVQLIMTSRWFDSQNMNRFQNNVITLEMQPLDESAINKYLENSGLPAASPELLSVLSTPLLLTLYADVEKHREKYQQISGIELEDNPDTAGKILGNFFQTQLYRAAEEANFDREAHLVLLEYWLPSVAFKMVENNSMKISEDDVWNCVDELEDSVRFEWYRKDRLRRLIQGRGSFDADSLINLAVNSLHFLHMTDNSYEFLHQNFRDYFAAYHIATEIKALNKDTTRLDKIELYIANRILPHEIISYISDITHEEEARPILNEDGWVYPGKDGIAPSKNSLVEKILSLWRNIEGGHAQTAVYNILNIMRVGRKDNLSWCDFSGLDLRACKMNRCHFVEWYKNDLFPSSFDGAWIDKEFFLNSGHEANITAVETDGDELVFSGDQNGVLKIYDCNAHTWKKTVQLHNSPIVDLAWNEKEKVLAVLYKKVLFIYSLEKLAEYASFMFFHPIDSTGKEKHLKDLRIFEYIRKEYNPNFKSISEIEQKAIFERLAPEYTVVMNEVEQVKVPVVNTIHTEEEMLITGDELEYKTFFLDEYQVGIVNDMGRGHRVVLANPGAGKSVLLLSKAFKYAGMYKESNILLTCYNSNLADSYCFKRSCANFGEGSNLHIMTFHKLVKKIYEECLHEKCDSNIATPKEIQKCIDLVKSGQLKLRFKAIFIDEVQIFDPQYLELCYLLLEDAEDNVFLMAGDLNQTVRKKSHRGDVPWKKIAGVQLDFTGRVRYIKKNYRNSKAIGNTGS